MLKGISNMKYEYHEDGTLPDEPHIFVFGSNLGGRHGAGAALIAFQKYGARARQGVGLQGSSYAIPTKNAMLEVLDLYVIESYVKKFLEFAEGSSDRFWITRVGCGLAGYADVQIAPLFRGASINCNFPKVWRYYLEKH